MSLNILSLLYSKKAAIVAWCEVGSHYMKVSNRCSSKSVLKLSYLFPCTVHVCPLFVLYSMKLFTMHMFSTKLKTNFHHFFRSANTIIFTQLITEICCSQYCVIRQSYRASYLNFLIAPSYFIFHYFTEPWIWTHGREQDFMFIMPHNCGDITLLLFIWLTML